MLDGNKIWVGTGNLNAEDGTPENRCYLLLNQANRHGIISGASGTGKTVTLKLLAEGYSNREIADMLVISVKTVETHRANIMRKHNFKNITELVLFAVRNHIIEP